MLCTVLCRAMNCPHQNLIFLPCRSKTCIVLVSLSPDSGVLSSFLITGSILHRSRNSGRVLFISVNGNGQPSPAKVVGADLAVARGLALSGKTPKLVAGTRRLEARHFLRMGFAKYAINMLCCPRKCCIGSSRLDNHTCRLSLELIRIILCQI